MITEGVDPLPIRVGGQRANSLDGLRALAFTGVFLLHVCPQWAPGGGVGVGVFFTLSGFIITTLLLRELDATGTVKLGRFYLRRFLRLTPALVLMVAITLPIVLVQLAANHAFISETTRGLPYVLTYTGNWLRAESSGVGLGLFAHTWTLGVEEQFYLFWPLVVVVAYRRLGIRGVLNVAMFVSIVSIVIRLSLFRHGLGYGRVRHGTDTLADQLLIGSILAIAVKQWPRVVQQLGRILWIPGVAYIAMTLAKVNQGNFSPTWGLTVLALSTAAVIAHLVMAPQCWLGRILSVWPLAKLGLISYGLYLWHYPINIMVSNLLAPGIERTIVVAGCTFAAALISYVAVERPLQRWRHQRLPS